jgi:hypothetical protein
VYIREAHPTDEWQVESNESEGILFAQPTTLDARSDIAQVCSLKLDLPIPTLIDDMENSTDRKYYALPDRLYLSDAMAEWRTGADRAPLALWHRSWNAPLRNTSRPAHSRPRDLDGEQSSPWQTLN